MQTAHRGTDLNVYPGPRPAVGWVAVLVLLLGTASPDVRAADEQGSERQRDARGEQQEDAQQIVYRPPLRGAPQTRVGGGTRGAGALPAVRVLAPDHTGWTTRAQPTLYWHASAATDVRTEFTLIRPGAAEPILEAALEPPAAAGIQTIDLGRYSVSLRPGVEYRWFVALVPDADQRSNDVVASGTIERKAPDASLQNELDGAPLSRRAAVYAAHGYWYEALDALADLVAQRPGDPTPRHQRAALLQQAGLDDVME